MRHAVFPLLNSCGDLVAEDEIMNLNAKRAATAAVAFLAALTFGVAPARAETPADALEVSFAPDTTILPLLSLTVHGNYSCDDSAGTTYVPLHVYAKQGLTLGDTTIWVDCQRDDQAWSATIVGSFHPDAETDVTAILIDDNLANSTAINEATLVAGVDVFDDSSTITVDDQGNAVVSGLFTCVVGTIQVRYDLSQTQADGTIVQGSVDFTVKCDDQGAQARRQLMPWSALIAPGGCAPILAHERRCTGPGQCVAELSREGCYWHHGDFSADRFDHHDGRHDHHGYGYGHY